MRASSGGAAARAGRSSGRKLRAEASRRRPRQPSRDRRRRRLNSLPAAPIAGLLRMRGRICRKRGTTVRRGTQQRFAVQRQACVHNADSASTGSRNSKRIYHFYRATHNQPDGPAGRVPSDFRDRGSQGPSVFGPRQLLQLVLGRLYTG